jgi:myo-inositol-1(or 4)-monophosphatase
MKPTLDWLQAAQKHIRKELDDLRPEILKAMGNIAHDFKEDKSVITEMDLLVERRLKDALAKLDASISFSGEETGTDYSKPTYWLVDPLDGTDSFIRGMPFVTNMVALIDNNQPVMSVIYNIVLDEYYLAIKGHGATCNGETIRVSDRPVNQSLVSLCRFPRGDESCYGLYDQMRAALEGLEFLNINASGYVLSSVARGSIEARINYKSVSKPWDVAPGALLVMEAGGRVGSLESDSFDLHGHRNAIAGNQQVFEPIMDFVRKFSQEKG